MTLPLVLLLCSLCAGQDQAALPSEPSWQRLIHLALIVNEKAVTSLELQRKAWQLAQKQDVARNDVQALRALQVRTVGATAREMLEEQGGHDLGFDPERVKVIVASQLERDEERAGSIAAMADHLAKEQLDSGAWRAETQAWVYRRLWSDWVTGKGPGPGGRPTNDAYVRPGLVWFEHQRLGSQVRFTQLILKFREDRGPEPTLVLAQELRERVLDGEDMGELCEEYGSTKRGTYGASEPLLVDSLRQAYPELHAFVEEAELGAISTILPYLGPDGRPGGYFFVQVDEWLDPPPFTERDFQRKLRAQVTRGLEDLRAMTGLGALARGAYVWPPGVLEPAAPAPAASAAPARSEEQGPAPPAAPPESPAGADSIGPPARP
jgi:hypothetical protein